MFRVEVLGLWLGFTLNPKPRFRRNVLRPPLARRENPRRLDCAAHTAAAWVHLTIRTLNPKPSTLHPQPSTLNLGTAVSINNVSQMTLSGVSVSVFVSTVTGTCFGGLALGLGDLRCAV